ncbi:MAG: hypothetical protein R3E79_39025 [Caldilineaceae bacterium]
MMAIPALNLDDRKFTDLVDELRRLIPAMRRGGLIIMSPTPASC